MSAGGVCALYFFLVFDPTVPSEAFGEDGQKRINNIGLLADRQNGVVVGAAAFIAGALLVGLSGKSSTVTGTRKCPQCLEVIQEGALKCRYCGHEFAKPVPVVAAASDGAWRCRCGHENEAGTSACASCKRSPNAVI